MSNPTEQILCNQCAPSWIIWFYGDGPLLQCKECWQDCQPYQISKTGARFTKDLKPKIFVNPYNPGLPLTFKFWKSGLPGCQFWKSRKKNLEVWYFEGGQMDDRTMYMCMEIIALINLLRGKIAPPPPSKKKKMIHLLLL